MDRITIIVNGETVVELEGESILIAREKEPLASARRLCESALESINKFLEAKTYWKPCCG